MEYFNIVDDKIYSGDILINGDFIFKNNTIKIDNGFGSIKINNITMTGKFQNSNIYTGSVTNQDSTKIEIIEGKIFKQPTVVKSTQTTQSITKGEIFKQPTVVEST